MRTSLQLRAFTVGAVLLTALSAWANPVLEWNDTAFKALVDARQGPVPGVRTMAAVHTAMFDAINAIEPKYQAFKFSGTAPAGASPDAAAAAAAHAVLAGIFPDRRAALDQALAASLGKVPAGAARDSGVAVGESAGKAVLAWCADDGFGAEVAYRPHTRPGTYVMTTLPAGLDAAVARPWVMTRVDQFRPAPPPSLSSDLWKRDLQETRSTGARVGSTRTPEQSQVAQFWVVTGAPAFNGIMRQAVAQKQMSTLDSARVTALTYVAFIDALIAVFDAKYAYNFWRPVTAVRNTDLEENFVIKRAPAWQPFVDAPLHPEYPCAHCISSASVTTVLSAFIGDEVKAITMQSPTLPGVTRQWTRLPDIGQEVANARIWSGVHYRNSADVGAAMGRAVAQHTMATVMKPR
jgi:hypothetical protein